MKKLGTLGLMADAGCHMALLEALLPILSSFQIVHSYILMDSKKMLEDVDIMVVEGGIRTKHDEDWVRLARKRSKTLVAIGSCACFGGIPALCNVYDVKKTVEYVYCHTVSTLKGRPPSEVPPVTQIVAPISQYVDVDVEISGCPPTVEEIKSAVEALLQGKKWELPVKNACDECEREHLWCRFFNFWSKFIKAPTEVKRIFDKPEPTSCLLEQGYLCAGPVTRGGCGAICPNIGIPCDGCRGPMAENPRERLSMFNALSLLALENAKKSNLTTQFLNSFCRYTLAIQPDILKSYRRESGGRRG